MNIAELAEKSWTSRGTIDWCQFCSNNASHYLHLHNGEVYFLCRVHHKELSALHAKKRAGEIDKAWEEFV